jgi:transposase-like protein
MTLNLKAKIYTDETAARRHMEKNQWPDGPICPHCGVINEATELQGDSTRPGVWKCRPCQKPFSVTVGTVFERSKIPLTKWLLALQLLTSSKKGISSHQLARMLGVTYKSAWFMSHRIREAMKPVSPAPLGGSGKIVEADETYLLKADGKKKREGAGGYQHKMKVLSLVERGGKIRSFKIGSASRDEIVPALRANVHPDSTLHTDGSQVYKFTGAVAKHESVDHSKEYVRDGVHTNTLEGFFSVFKRGMVGT